MSHPFTLVLTRTQANADGVFGTLMARSGHVFLTCEDDWKENQPGESCIPTGTYPIKRRWSPKHGGPVFEVENVPGRSDIEIHAGNTENDTLGCILLGLTLGHLTVAKDEDTGELHATKEAVLQSRQAFSQFMATMDGTDDGEIVIQWAPGLP